MLAPFDQIHVCREEEAKMRRRMLRALPCEHIETIWGKIEQSTLHICVFMPVDIDKQSPVAVEYDEVEIDHSEDEAKLFGMIHLGTIHSHPDRSELLFSEADLRGSQEDSDIILGICAIEFLKAKRGKKRRRRCRIAYWPTVRPLPVKHSYWSQS
jgi:proteasome lid subunit RPN8/RPN11